MAKRQPRSVDANRASDRLSIRIDLASGARIATSLLYEMKRRQVQYGLATLCIGGGMGTALVVENLL